MAASTNVIGNAVRFMKTAAGEIQRDAGVEHVAVLGVPPIDSAQKAVQAAAVMAHIEKQRNSRR